MRYELDCPDEWQLLKNSFMTYKQDSSSCEESTNWSLLLGRTSGEKPDTGWVKHACRVCTDLLWQKPRLAFLCFVSEVEFESLMTQMTPE